MGDLPPSLWAATTPPGLAPEPPEGEIRADVAIIGGGFTGLSAALHLTEAGIGVALLEAHEPGWGASGRNGGQVNPGLKLGRDALVRLYGAEAGAAAHRAGQEAPEFLFALIRRHGIDCDAAQIGTLRLAHSDAARHALDGAAATLRAEGVPVTLLDRAETARMTGSPRYLGGMLDPRGGNVQPLSLSRGLARQARARGARILFPAPVTAIARQDGAWRIAAGTGSVRAAQVLIATDGYTGRLWPGLHETILPVTSFQIATEKLPDAVLARVLPGRQSAYDSRRLVLYFRIAGDRLVLGGRASFSGRENRRTDYAVLRKVLAGLYPELATIGCAFSWGGSVSLTRDHLPHLAALAPGLFAAMGYNGRGVAMATRLGALAAERLAGPEHAAFPLSPAPRFPLFGLRQPALHLAMQYHRVMDRLGR